MVRVNKKRKIYAEIDNSRSALLAIELDFATAALNSPEPDLRAALDHVEAAQELLLEVPPGRRDELIRRARTKSRQMQQETRGAEP